MSQAKFRLLRAYGAEVVILPPRSPPDQPENYVIKAKHLVHILRARSSQHFYNQFHPEALTGPRGPRSCTDKGQVTLSWPERNWRHFERSGSISRSGTGDR